MNKNNTLEQWRLLMDGTLVRGGKFIHKDDQFCVDYLDLKKFVGKFSFTFMVHSPGSTNIQLFRE